MKTYSLRYYVNSLTFRHDLQEVNTSVNCLYVDYGQTQI